MLARTFEWWPILELEKGKSYKLHHFLTRPAAWLLPATHQHEYSGSSGARTHHHDHTERSRHLSASSATNTAGSAII